MVAILDETYVDRKRESGGRFHTSGMGSMLQYDADVIEAQAESLNRQAVEVQFVRPVLFGSAGFLLGLLAALLLALLGARTGWHEALSPALLLWGAPSLFGLIGFLRGREEARELRFRAHVALCQVEIERHLRRITRT